MNRFVALVLLALAIPFIAGGQSAPGALYKSDGEGWQIQPPKTWKHAVKDGKLMIGSDTEAGLMLAWFQAGITYEQAQEYAKQPYQESGLVLMPGKATPFTTKAGKAFAVDYSGKAMDGSMIKSRTIAIAGAKGVIYVAGVTTEPQYAALSKKTDEMAKTVTFFTPKVAAGGAGASLIKGPMCAWSGSSGYSSSSKMFFDGKGYVSWGSESSFSGSIKDGGGNETASYSGYGGNQNMPSDVGAYTVIGDAVNIRWGDGTVQNCTVHHRNSGVIAELMCGKKLYGRGLCE